MKKIFLITLILLSFCKAGRTQNLVQNPSFEVYDTCPTSQGQIKYSTGWNSYGYSPDYFNSCNGGGYGVPLNNAGYQTPSTGNAYAAIGTYANYGNIREYIGGKLTAPLLIGVKYFVSFKVCLSDNPSIDYATNKLGVLFSTISYSIDSFCPPPCASTILPPQNFAHIYSDSIIKDTANWTTITGSFFADSSYQYIIVGNHFDDAHTSVILLDSSGANVAAYYLIDDIYVGTDSLSVIETFNIKNTINIYPNPANDRIIINIPNKNGNAVLRVYDIAGQLVDERKLFFSQNLILLNVLNAGIYILKIQISNQIFINKLIISN